MPPRLCDLAAPEGYQDPRVWCSCPSLVEAGKVAGTAAAAEECKAADTAEAPAVDKLGVEHS
jgi:hypothetical protein